MGAAKNRGPRETRVAESIARQQAEKLERMRQLAELEAAMTPEQKAKRKQARQTLTMMAGITAGVLVN